MSRKRSDSSSPVSIACRAASRRLESNALRLAMPVSGSVMRFLAQALETVAQLAGWSRSRTRPGCRAARSSSAWSRSPSRSRLISVVTVSGAGSASMPPLISVSVALYRLVLLSGVAEVGDQLGERLLHPRHARAQLVLLAPEREEALVDLVVHLLAEGLLVRGQDVEGAPELGRLAGVVGVPHAEIRRHRAGPRGPPCARWRILRIREPVPGSRRSDTLAVPRPRLVGALASDRAFWRGRRRWSGLETPHTI